MSKNSNPRKPRGGGGVTALLIIILLLLMALSGFMIYLCTTVVNQGNVQGKPDILEELLPQKEPEILQTSPTETEPPETTLPEPEHVVSTATITTTGDLLMHTPLYMSKYNSISYNGGDYDFSPIFKFVKDYSSAADYMIGNLETTLYGPEKPYSGFPMFNTPDQIVDGAREAGFDMLLTANNHCNDTGMDGILRTLQVIRDQGLDTLGTNMNQEEKRYIVKEINGIKVGMTCFSYDDSQNGSRQAFNGNPIYDKDRGTVNSFPLLQFGKDREPFFNELESQIAAMKEEGADAIMLFLHWGIEYRLNPNQEQKDLAQKFCDMGVDVIVGGHPHVIEPVELLTSTTDPDHRTVCLYSLGNAVSNQRHSIMREKYIPTPHTEDGMLFSVTFEKYSDGTVYLAGVEVLPTWVNKHNDNGKLEYNILPLDEKKQDQWQDMFSIGDSTFDAAVKSYERTMELVGEGIAESNLYLSQQKEIRDGRYLAMVQPGYTPDAQETLAPAA